MQNHLMNKVSLTLRTGLCLILVLPCAITMAHTAAVHTPKPGSAERAAIMDALRKPVMKKVGRQVIFKVGSLKVKDGWAFLQGSTLYANEKPLEDRFAWGETAALLRKSSGRWKVLVWGFATDIGVMDEAKRKYPQAPRAIYP